MEGSGPGFAFVLLLIIVGVLVLSAAGVWLTKRRGGTSVLEAPPKAPPEAPPTAPPEAPPEPDVREAPPEAAPEAAPPDVVRPPAPAEPIPEEPPVVEAPPEPDTVVVLDEPPVVEAPPVEAPPAAPAPPKRRVRGIGASLARLFRGTALTAQDWEELEEILLRADVGVAATDRIVSTLRARKDVEEGLTALREELLLVLGDGDRSLHRRADGLSVWLVTGVNGTGKTTTIGKLAAQLRDDGARVVLAAADTFRAAADQQLETWADRAGAEIVKHAPGADPAAVVFDAVKAAQSRGAEVLIVDTAGRLQTKRNLMEELGKLRRVLAREAGDPDETLLVLDATTGQNGVQQARAFAEAVQVTGLALTKLDGTAKGGIVVAVQQELGIPVKLVGVGEGIGDLAPFDPTWFVDELLAP